MHSNVYIFSEPRAAYSGVLFMPHCTIQQVLLTEYTMKFYEAEIFCKLTLLVLFTLSCILICTFPLNPMQHIEEFCVWHIIQLNKFY